MTLSIWLNLFDHSVELGSSDISGLILSSHYGSSRDEAWEVILVVRALVHVAILDATNVRSGLGGLNMFEPYLAGIFLWSGELVVVVQS